MIFIFYCTKWYTKKMVTTRRLTDIMAYYGILIFLLFGFFWNPVSPTNPVNTYLVQHQHQLQESLSIKDRHKELPMLENKIESYISAPGPQVYVPNLPQSQIDALHALYTSTNGDRWIWISRPNADNTQNGVTIPWNFTDNPNPCIQRWQGVLCNSNCTVSPKRTPYIYCTVLGLELDSHNLDGTLPIDLTNLTSLNYLSLADNRIKNPLPDNLLSNMTSLVSLDLSANLLLGGSIPDNFSNLIDLQILDLSRSRFSGSIPPSLFKLPSLLYLDIGNNRLTGSISSSICQLPLVEYVFLEFNGFTGPLPPCIGQMETIRTLMLANNSLSQSIPDTLSGLININTFDLSFNNFDQKIPESISTLTTLGNLALQFNSLTGTVPDLLSLSRLKVLALYVNELEGPAPNVSASTALTLYQINYNQLTGTIVGLNTSNLICITVQGNYITGAIPQLVNGSRSLVSPELKDDLLQLEPIVDSTEFFKRIAAINITTNMLFYVNFSDNAFTGQLPHWIFTSPLLTYVYMFDNLLTGTIPEIPTNITWIGVLYLDSNYLTGTIPQTILQQQYLVNLRLADNELTGTVSSSIFNSTFLIEVAIEDNMFTGPLPTLPLTSANSSSTNSSIPTGYPGLAILSFSNNEFTGEIDTRYFTTLPSLEVFAASSNCLSGYIPEEICEAKLLRQLILDGMSSATQCRSFIFPALRSTTDGTDSSDGNGWFNSFVLDHGMKGSIPSCLFEMPLLQSLYLSGNELDGSIPHDLNISKSLINLRLSYNRLTGSIPPEVQYRSWTILDLSFNKLSGHLLSSFNPSSHNSGNVNGSIPEVVPKVMEDEIARGAREGILTLVMKPFNNLFNSVIADGQPDNVTNRIKNKNISHADDSSNSRTLYLDVNRLSGRLPGSVKEVDDISILNGNIFYCDFSRAALPRHDPRYHSYSCGSNSMNQALFGWIIALFFLLVFLLWLKYRAYKLGKTLYEEYVLPLLRDIRLYNHAFELAESKLTLTFPPPPEMSTTVIVDSVDGEKRSSMLAEDAEKHPIPAEPILAIPQNNKNSNIDLIVSKMSFVFAWRFFHDLRKYCCIIAIILIVVLMPMFRVLNVFQSSFENKYAWEFSAIYVSGFASGLILLVTFASVIALVYFFLDMKLLHLMLPADALDVDPNLDITGVENTKQPSRKRKNKGFKFLRASSFYRESSYSYSFSTAYPNGQALDLSNTDVGKEKDMKTIQEDEDTEDRDSRATTDTSILENSHPSRNTESNQNQPKPCFPFYLSFKKRQYLILLLVGFINTISMTLINISYVIIVVYVTNQYLIIMSQLCLAVIKLWWNDVFLWQLLRGTKRFIHKLWIRQEVVLARQRGGNTDEKLNDHNLLVEEMVSRMLSADIFLVVCALLFNNVIAPCLSIAVVSPSCFYNTFVAATSLSATYRYCSTYILLARKQGVCLVTIEGTTTFSPPFIYSYNCASLLPVNYTAVYIYMALMSGFVMPAFKLALKYINEYTSIGSNESSILYKLMNRYLSAVLRKLQPHPYLLRKSDLKKFSASTGITDEILLRAELMKDFLPENREAFALKLRAIKPIFDKNRLVVRVIGFLALMASFGVVFPPLAVIICVSICSFTYFEQLNIGRVLYQSEQLGYYWYRQKIGYDLEGIVEVFIPAILPMTFVASLLFACLIFDTFGDRYGHRVGIVPALFMVLVPGCIWLTVRVDWRTIWAYVTGKKQSEAAHDRPHSMAVELKETNGVISNPLNADDN